MLPPAAQDGTSPGHCRPAHCHRRERIEVVTVADAVAALAREGVEGFVDQVGRLVQDVVRSLSLTRGNAAELGVRKPAQRIERRRLAASYRSQSAGDVTLVGLPSHNGAA